MGITAAVISHEVRLRKVQTLGRASVAQRVADEEV